MNERRITVGLSSDQARKLAKFRADTGAKSDAEALRALIELGVAQQKLLKADDGSILANSLMERITGQLQRLDDEIRTRLSAMDGTRPPTTWNGVRWVAKNGYNG